MGNRIRLAKPASPSDETGRHDGDFVKIDLAATKAAKWLWHLAVDPIYHLTVAATAAAYVQPHSTPQIIPSPSPTPTAAVGAPNT